MQDQYDVIDLTDNEISKLENFPLLKQLNTLILHNNRINRIEENLGSYLPKLEWLMLNNNRVSEFSDIEALGSCASLTHLSLIDNPITLKPEYRLFVISRLPNLRMLDFRKIKLQVGSFTTT